MTLQSVIASCIACSLLMLPRFASAQDKLGIPLQDNSFQLAPANPASEAPANVITPGALPTGQLPDQPVAPDAPGNLQGTGVDIGNVGDDGNAGDMGTAVEVSDDGNPGVDGEKTEAQKSLEERRAAWMAGLKQLTFKQLVKRIRDDERAINQLYINMPMTRPDLQIVSERQIAGLQAEVVVLNELLEPAAVEAFRSDPMESEAATVKVFEVLASKLAPRGHQAKYDPQGALRLVNTILEIKGGEVGMDPEATSTPEDEPFMRIIFQGYLASYGMQDFKSADEFLTRLENLNIGLDPKLREDFEATLDAWKKEESLRSQEAMADDLPRVKLETTDGDVIIELFENEAPNTVANFIKLVKEGYYDGLEFFHVVPSSYARTGCVSNDGTTNPGYRIRNEFEDGRRHFAGTVAMQNDGENTAGSQFIILHRPDPNLEGKIVAFGRVLEGLDLVYGFKKVNRIRNPGGEATVINKAIVLRDRGHAYEPEIIEDPASMRLRLAREEQAKKEAEEAAAAEAAEAAASSKIDSMPQDFLTEGLDGSSDADSPETGSSTLMPVPGVAPTPTVPLIPSTPTTGSGNRFLP